MTRNIIWLPTLLAVLLAACSGLPSSPSATGTSTGATPQAIATNAPGGIVQPAPATPGISRPSVPPSVRVESDWPKAKHISFVWGHSGEARYAWFSMKRRDDNRPAIVVKPNEHTDGAGAVMHRAEQDFECGIYEGTAAYIYPEGSMSPTFTFTLNHCAESLPNINPTPLYQPPVG